MNRTFNTNRNRLNIVGTFYVPSARSRRSTFHVSSNRYVSMSSRAVGLMERASSVFRFCLILLLAMCRNANAQNESAPLSKTVKSSAPTSWRSVLVVVGAPGEPVYVEPFNKWASEWKAAIGESCTFEWIDGTQDQSANEKKDRDRLLEWIGKNDQATEKWLVFIGHGTSDRDSHKLNLRGPDVSADELAKELNHHVSTRWIVINGASSSGPFINALSGKNRVIVTATKSGAEQNYARFGEYLSQTLTDPTADLDHDNSVSILESFLAASSRVAQFYANEDRLASEQALLDDNGDKKGTPAAFYRGARPVKAPADGLLLDGSLASRVIVTRLGRAPAWTPEQTQRIEAIETKIEGLRAKKKELDTEAYYSELERLFFEIIQARSHG